MFAVICYCSHRKLTQLSFSKWFLSGCVNFETKSMEDGEQKPLSEAKVREKYYKSCLLRAFCPQLLSATSFTILKKKKK